MKSNNIKYMREELLEVPHDCKTDFESGCYFCDVVYNSPDENITKLYKALVKDRNV